MLRGAAHGLMAETPNAFNDAVLKFLAEIDADTRDSLVLLIGGAGKAIGNGNGDEKDEEPAKKSSSSKSK